MKHHKIKKQNVLFRILGGRFSYKQKSLLTGAAALFLLAWLMDYVNSKSPVILAAPELGIAASSFIINLLIGLMLFAAFILASKAFRNKK